VYPTWQLQHRSSINSFGSEHNHTNYTQSRFERANVSLSSGFGRRVNVTVHQNWKYVFYLYGLPYRHYPFIHFIPTQRRTNARSFCSSTGKRSSGILSNSVHEYEYIPYYTAINTVWYNSFESIWSHYILGFHNATINWPQNTCLLTTIQELHSAYTFIIRKHYEAQPHIVRPEEKCHNSRCASYEFCTGVKGKVNSPYNRPRRPRGEAEV
jgi:hypothetical protein